ncbi:MAG: apolipoprotein N-acyltransferase [Candidatus Omnitrophica bacterium]|jgi:apolipoprotein N-acyltransferase|nr:apolipoprotein N-acyltransferase [Candidatus Omnitrophota bacterium]
MLIKIITAALSGLLTGLSFNFPQYSFLIWFSLVFFLFAIKNSSLKISLGVGIIFTLFYYGTVIFWIAYVTKLGLFFLLLYLSFYNITFAIVGKYFLDRPFRLISLPCLWIILEYLKENIWCGFGWANLGYSQYKNLYLIQTADLLGVKFISFQIIMVNILIWEGLCFLKNPKSNKTNSKNIFFKLGLVTIIFLISIIYSVYRLNCSSDIHSDKLKVTIVQPSIPQELKWKHSAIPEILRRLEILGQKAEEDSLLIFPEAAWPLLIDVGSSNYLNFFIKELKRNSLVGAVIKDNKENFYNSALLFDKEGTLLDSYYKIRLVPFGEYVPLRDFLSFISVLNSVGDISRGEKYTEFSYRKKKFSVLICFEDIFPQFTSRMARQRDLLINITNDAWFYGEPQASQHLGIMVFRAIENRISIVRAANTGFSGWVSPEGKIDLLTRDRKYLFIPATENFEIQLRKKRSFYNKYGEIFVYFSILLVAFIYVGILLSKKYFFDKFS